MPYYQNQMTLDLTDKNTGRLLKTVNFSQAIEHFKKVYPNDPGGTPVTLPLLQESTPLYLVAGIVLAVLLLAVIFMMSRKK